MPDQTLDRRVRRTRQRLKEALLELMEEQDYDGITIEDITRRADVGRSTFYSHFDSKEDLLFSGFDKWLLSLPESAAHEVVNASYPDHSPRFRFSLPMLQHVRTQKRFIQAAVFQGANARIRWKTTALLVEVVRRELDRISPAPAKRGLEHSGVDAELMREARAHAVAGAFLGLVSWWLNGREKLSAEAVDNVFQEVIKEP